MRQYSELCLGISILRIQGFDGEPELVVLLNDLMFLLQG